MARTDDPTAAMSIMDIARFWEVFSSFDTDGDGAITTAELGMALRAIDEDDAEEVLAAIVETYDLDHNGGINFDEFLRWGARSMQGPGAEA